MEEIVIPFRPVKAEDLQDANNYYREICDVYTDRYLEGLGVEPTASQRRLVHRHAPLEKCKMSTAWGETGHRSAIADELRIMPPRPVEKPVFQPIQHSFFQRKNSKADAELNKRVAREYFKPMSTTIPDVTKYESAASSEEKRQILHKFSDVDFITAALTSMQLADLLASQKLSCDSMSLTQELEHVRSQVRLEKKCENHEETGHARMDHMQNELHRLKSDFILPFACEKPRGTPEEGAMVPWQHLQSNQSIDVPEESRAEAEAPIDVTLEAIQEEAVKYSQQLPLELLTHREEPALFEPIRAHLAVTEVIRLTGLFAHLLYWVVFKHLHSDETRLSDQSIHSLQVTLHDYWSTVLEPFRDFPMGVSFVIPSICLSIKRGVQWIFTTRYPAVFAEGDALCQLNEQINVLFMQLFDPDCAHTRFSVLDNTKQGLKLWKRYDMALASKGQGVATRAIMKNFRTSTAVNTLMGEECTGRPGNAKTRNLLAKSASDTALTSCKSKLCRPGKEKRPQMDELQQEKLFKVACKQLSRAGLEAMPTCPGSATANRAISRASSVGRLGSIAESRLATLNGRRRRAMKACAGSGMCPVREMKPTVIEFMQRKN